MKNMAYHSFDRNFTHFERSPSLNFPKMAKCDIYHGYQSNEFTNVSRTSRSNIILTHRFILVVIISIYFYLIVLHLQKLYPKLVKSLKTALTVINDMDISRMDTARDVCDKSTVYEPAVIVIDDIDRSISINRLMSLLTKDLDRIKYACKSLNKYIGVSLSSEKKTGKVMALITLPRAYLHGSNVFTNYFWREGLNQKTKVKEVKRLAPYMKPGKKYEVKMYGCEMNYSVQTHLMYLNIKLNPGYRITDGGLNFISYMHSANLQQTYLANMIERWSSTGIERVVLKFHKFRDSKMKLASSLSTTYQKYLYFTTGDLGVDEQKKERFSVRVKKANCIAIGTLSLSYNTDNVLYRAQRLKIFQYQVEIACEMQKSLLLSLNAEETLHEDCINTLRQYKECLPPCCIEVTGSHFTQNFKSFLQEFDCYVVISGRHLLHGTYAVLKKMLQNKVISLRRLIIHSCAPDNFFKSRSIIQKNNIIQPSSFQTYQDFKNNFLQKEIKYLRPECVEYLSSSNSVPGQDLTECDPCVVHVIIELLCSLVNMSPCVVAPILKRNCEEFYQFDS